MAVRDSVRWTSVALVAVLLMVAWAGCAKKPAQPAPRVEPQVTVKTQPAQPKVEPVEPTAPKVETYQPKAEGRTETRSEAATPAGAGAAGAGEAQAMAAQKAAAAQKIGDVFFAFDKSDLTRESRDTLSANAEILRATPGIRILIEGHCDERGTNEYNLGLGERRAKSAKDYLVSLGIDGGRIDTISYGEERPFAQGHDESAWSQNRRAHFVVR